MRWNFYWLRIYDSLLLLLFPRPLCPPQLPLVDEVRWLLLLDDGVAAAATGASPGVATPLLDAPLLLLVVAGGSAAGVADGALVGVASFHWLSTSLRT